MRRRQHGVRRRSGACLAGALLLVAGAAEAREPRGSAVRDPRPALVGVASPCREQLAPELVRGEIDPGVSCEAERRVAQRQQLRAARSRVGFGLVERSRVGLATVSLLLSDTRGCSRWPLRLPGRETLGLFEAKAAGCWIRRYTGPLMISGVLPDGRKVPGLLVVAVVEGRAELDLARISVSLDRRGTPGLDGFVRIELGVDGWAGSIDMVEQRARLAAHHADSVLRGRGVPGLLAVRHPELPEAEDARNLALAATLRRQEEDLRAVRTGELSPRRFLERHAWSPYRQVVAAMGRE